MVPTSKHVQEVYTGKDGVLSALQMLDDKSRAETLCLDQSTIEQGISKAVALKMREVGADMMDAPVSGGEISLCFDRMRCADIPGVVGAKDGTLAIMVGGDPESYEKAVPILSPMARKVTHCGDLGTGLAAKISNKYVSGFIVLSDHEH